MTNAERATAFLRLEDGTRPVLWCTGDEARAALTAAGFVVAPSANGAAPTQADAEELPDLLVRGQRHVLLADNAASAQKAGEELAPVLLRRGAAEVAVASWPATLPDGRETPAGFDTAAWFAADFTAEQLRELVLATAEPVEAPEQQEQAGSSGPKQSTVILRMARDTGVLPFRDPDGGLWLAVPDGDHQVAMPIGEKAGGVHLWLTRLYAKRNHGSVPSSTGLTEAVRGLAAQADDGAVSPVHLRVAPHRGGMVLDLGQPDWRCAVVTAKGWDVAPCPDGLYFRRPSDGRALTMPTKPDDLGRLRDLLGKQVDDHTFAMLVAWSLSCLSPDLPERPILALYGEEGSGKTTTARLLRSLIDPCGEAGRRATGPPKDEEALVVQAVSKWVVAIDNLSHLPEWLADALCRLSSGGGFSRRMLYTDFGEASVDVRRSIILTGIAEVATRSDLSGRCLAVTLPTIATRALANDLWREADAAAPAILGGLLTAASEALLNRDKVAGPWPRMADFAAWVQAAEDGGALQWPAGTFREAYDEVRAQATASVLEASPLPHWLREVVERAPGREWKGSAADMLAAILTQVAVEAPRGLDKDGNTKFLPWPQDPRKRKEWPASPDALGRAIRRLAPALRANDIEVQQHRDGKNRTWRVTLPTREEG